MWTKQGTMPTSTTRLTMKESIVHHLDERRPVWLTGHSKGGAVATTAAARLVCGEEAVDVSSVGSPRLSVVTFNAPKALEAPSARAYDEAFEKFGLRHLRIEHADDIVRKVPAGLCHVGGQMEVGSLSVELSSPLISGIFAAVSAHGLGACEDDFDDDNGGSSDHPLSPQPPAFAAQWEAEDGGTAPRTRHQTAVPYTVVLVGKAGAGKSTLGNHLLNMGVEADDYEDFFKEAGGPEACTAQIKYVVSADGRLAVVDTPGMPDTTPSKTLEHFDNIVEKVRGLERINLLLFVAVEGRTNPRQYAEYRTLLKQFNLLPCDKLLVCRQHDYARRPPSTKARDEKRAGGKKFATGILEHSEMDMPYILHMGGSSPEAQESLEGISKVARSSMPVPVGRLLRTYAERQAHVRRLASRENRLGALREDMKALKAAVRDAQIWRGVHCAWSLAGELASIATAGVSGVAACVGVPLINFYSNTIRRSSRKIENVQREIDTSCVDEGELQKAREELAELEALGR